MLVAFPRACKASAVSFLVFCRLQDLKCVWELLSVQERDSLASVISKEAYNYLLNPDGAIITVTSGNQLHSVVGML